MPKKISIVLVLAFALAVSSAAVAEITNRDLQLMGGVLASSSVESFFFAPLEDGIPRRWGIFAMSKAGSGPIAEINGVPARFVYADQQNVYYLGYTNEDRTVHALYQASTSGGSPQTLLSGIADAFVEENDVFFYVSEEDPYTLRRYSIRDKKASPVKDMSASNKKITDAVVAGGELYFLTQAANGTEDGYKLNKSSNKATNLDKPNPGAPFSILYDKYRVYATDSAGTNVYAMPIEGKRALQVGAGRYNMGLTNPRFGGYVYTYDADTHQVVGCALDGSDNVSLTLEGDTLSMLILGGSPSELLFYNYGGIYATTGSLGSANRLFDFDNTMGGLIWNYIVPAANNHVIVMGYTAETMTHRDSMPPTAIFVFTRAGELVFSHPEFDPNAVPQTPGEATMPAELGQVPHVEAGGEGDDDDEDDSFFVF